MTTKREYRTKRLKHLDRMATSLEKIISFIEECPKDEDGAPYILINQGGRR